LVEEFEEHAAVAELMNSDKVMWVVKYVKSKEVASFWKSLPSFTFNLRDYAKLKVEILAQYPGVETGQHYIRNSLRCYIYISILGLVPSNIIHLYGQSPTSQTINKSVVQLGCSG
jgi:hypothetical protein